MHDFIHLVGNVKLGQSIIFINLDICNALLSSSNNLSHTLVFVVTNPISTLASSFISTFSSSLSFSLFSFSHLFQFYIPDSHSHSLHFPLFAFFDHDDSYKSMKDANFFDDEVYAPNNLDFSNSPIPNKHTPQRSTIRHYNIKKTSIK